MACKVNCFACAVWAIALGVAAVPIALWVAYAKTSIPESRDCSFGLLCGANNSLITATCAGVEGTLCVSAPGCSGVTTVYSDVWANGANFSCVIQRKTQLLIAASVFTGVAVVALILYFCLMCFYTGISHGGSIAQTFGICIERFDE